MTIKVYDDLYPHGVAGHVEPDAFNENDEPAVTTHYGTDWGFSGDNLAKEDNGTHEAVGTNGVSTQIGAVAHESDKLHAPNADVARDANFGNVALNIGSQRILKPNIWRREITLTNQSGTTVYVGKNPINFPSASTTPPPDVVYLPGGAARTLKYRGPLFVYSANAAVVIDWVEEVY
jgi:hypothetical protein